MSELARSDERDSLILGNGVELELNLGTVDAAGLPPVAYERAEEFGSFTGERIFSGNPKLYRAIVALLARGVPYREISEICSVSVNTVCAVCQREGTPIETIRERIGRLGLDVAALTVEAMRDMLADPVQRAKLSLKDLAVAHGIAFTNAQLALGGVTARLDYGDKTPAPGHDDYLAYIRNVTGSSAEKPALKEAAAHEGATAIEVATTTPAETEPKATN